MNKIHPMYKILAVIVVGSVAKALFSEERPVSNVATNVAGRVAESTLDRLSSVPPPKP